MTGWIPVSQCLPPEGWVLVCVVHHWGSRHTRDVQMGTWDTYRTHWRSRLGHKLDGDVTHWMPLPELPQEDTTEQATMFAEAEG